MKITWRKLQGSLRGKVLFFSCCTLLLWMTSRSYGQDYIYATGHPSFATEIPVENGFINVGNGNLHLEIPLSSLPQRGNISADVKLVYDSRIWHIVNIANPQVAYSFRPDNIPNSQGGWRVVTPLSGKVTNITSGIYCNGVNNNPGATSYSSWVYTDPDGTSHWFNGLQTFQAPSGGCPNGVGPQDKPNADAMAADSSSLHAFVTNYNNITIYARDGSQVYPRPTDSNGNYLSAGTNGGLLTDTLQRSPVNVTQNGNQTYYDVLTWQGNRARYTVTTGTILVQTHFQQSAVAEFRDNITVIQSIQLPDGGSYTFNYDAGAYGELTSITLPNGGQINYGYSNFLDSYQNQNRWITSMAVDGGTWQFTPSVISQCAANGTGCQEKVTVTRPATATRLADDIVYTFVLNNGAWNSQVDYYTGSNAPGSPGRSLSATATTDYDFSNPCGMNCAGAQYIKAFRNTLTLPNGKSSKTEYTYDNPAYGNLTSVKEWDYYPTGAPPAVPYRETDYSYKTDTAYIQKNMLDRLSGVVIKDSSGKPGSQIQISYDEPQPGLVHIDGVPQHDDQNFPYTDLVRGNVTTVQRWLQGTNGGSDRWISSHSAYDQLGNAVSQTDPLGAQTTFAYSSAYGYAYLTQVQSPNTASTNPPTTTQHIVKTSYDLSSGLIASTTDENSQTTGYGYDNLGRLTSLTNPPGGGNTTFAYPDPTYNTRTEQIDGSGTTKVTYIHFDTLGRPDRKGVTNEEGTFNVQDQCYDTRGQLQFNSYPYQTNGATPKVCSGNGDSYTYDTFGRLDTITHSDQSFIGFGFDNAAQVFYDERGIVTKVKQYDAFGRTASVCEVSSTSYIGSSSTAACGQDYAATGYLTIYQYDVLDDLLQVNQGNRTVRTKAYDSLGRLVADAIPEMDGQSSVVSYSYDDNDNLQTRKRPKPNQSDPTQLLTTTYTYDPLGRLLSTGYDDGVTPPVNYYYDETTMAGHSGSMGIGRLTSKIARGPRGNGSGFYYDAMGNVLYDYQSTPRLFATGSYTTMGYQYNLASSRTSFTNGAAGVTYSYLYHSGGTTGGRTIGMTSNLADSTHPGTLISGIHYGPFGRTQASYGNGVVEAIGYSPRGSVSSKRETIGAPPVGVAPAQATITLSGQPYSDSSGNCDIGYVSMSVGSASTPQITYICGFTAQQMAQSLVNNFSSPDVSASASNGQITLTAKHLGTVGNGIAFSFTYSSVYGSMFPAPYTLSPNSGSLSGGTDSHPVNTIYSFNNALRLDNLITSSNDSVMGNLSFGYDDLKRLNSGTGYTWDFDAYANRWHQNGALSVQQSFDANNHGSGVTYDVLGNVTNDGFHTFTYDAENRIIAIDGGSTATYTYDVDGRRVHKILSGGVSEFVYDLANNVVATVGPSGTWTQAENYFDGSHIGSYNNAPGNSAAYFSYNDWEQTDRVTTDWTGSVVEVCSSQIYGDGLSCSGPDYSAIHFTGYQHDFESGLDYANLRYYNPRLGRFMSADLLEGDPSNPQSFNRYGYVNGNPANFRDPSGLDGGGPCAIGVATGNPEICIIDLILGIGQLIHFLFGGGHPHPVFHGTVNPRPRPPLSENLGLPGFIHLQPQSLLGGLLPNSQGCEFGACTPIGDGVTKKVLGVDVSDQIDKALVKAAKQYGLALSAEAAKAIRIEMNDKELDNLEKLNKKNDIETNLKKLDMLSAIAERASADSQFQTQVQDELKSLLKNKQQYINVVKGGK